MSKAVKCDGTGCPEWLPEDTYNTDGREWIEVTDRMDKPRTQHFHSVACLHTYSGGAVDPVTGEVSDGRAILIRTR